MDLVTIFSFIMCLFVQLITCPCPAVYRVNIEVIHSEEISYFYRYCQTFVLHQSLKIKAFVNKTEIQNNLIIGPFAKRLHRRPDRQSDGRTKRHTDGTTVKQIEEQTDNRMYERTDGKTDGWTEGQRWTVRPMTSGQNDRQRDQCSAH